MSQSSSRSKGTNAKEGKSGDLKWWQLSLLGIGCTIGTGYFLGSGLGIKITGPSIVISFLLAAAGTYIVYHLLALMTTADPQEGSFCFYAEKAFGRWAGFSCGWNYWSSKILIMGSQLTALAILSRFWFPGIPLWIFAAVYAVLSIAVVLLGTKGFDKVENILAVTKTAAIVMFIILAGIALIGWIHGGNDNRPGIPNGVKAFFPAGYRGFWSSLVYAFFAYGGIETIGLMSMQLKNKEDAPKAGQVMLVVLTIIYVISIGYVVTMVSYEAITEKESPFVTALSSYKLPFFPHVFNAAILTAGFSTMTASLFAVTNLLVTLSKDGDAPRIFKKKLKFRSLPLPSLALAALGLSASVVTSLLLPGKIYAYITTAAGILQMYNWGFIIISAYKVLELKVKDKWLSITGLLLLVLAVTGTIMEKSIRLGFFVSVVLVVLIAIVTWIMTRVWNKSGKTNKQPTP
ncbi:Aromatic amino acid transport protein AroP [Paenibacillus auburnensis]|uniref:Aromatic amino acid transport protein AroP n=1 Tax=Paenibacillus auburnensis TaxID=2905649 RepID=A0ABM9BRL5_9BACL|nr:amino acid permease [Paenibacillus auburnensis]CAH1192041.1 Aromatic amino acid transport protein AroP [Paenibacillus auburnensis]